MTTSRLTHTTGVLLVALTLAAAAAGTASAQPADSGLARLSRAHGVEVGQGLRTDVMFPWTPG